jgi:hypothetical protein
VIKLISFQACKDGTQRMYAPVNKRIIKKNKHGTIHKWDQEQKHDHKSKTFQKFNIPT